MIWGGGNESELLDLILLYKRDVAAYMDLDKEGGSAPNERRFDKYTPTSVPQRVMNIGVSIKMLDSVLPGPSPDILKVAARVNDIGNLLGLLIGLDPRPGQRRDVASAHQALTDRVDAVLDVVHAHELVFSTVRLFGIEPFAYHVLNH